MNISLLSTHGELASYDRWVKDHPHGTLWQSLEWKEYQEALGRQARVYAALEGARIAASALVVIDRTSFGLSTWDIPRGPLGDGAAALDLLEHLEGEARASRCMSLFLSPSTPLPLRGRG
ncbi:MAG: peptidoglycan bridge formation glycyltransferase FemA/FemB family protein, partial [Patescibacteria group bacterium]